ncbi:hypothetical protein BST61_g2120 [Cercospora zeina]
MEVGAVGRRRNIARACLLITTSFLPVEPTSAMTRRDTYTIDPQAIDSWGFNRNGYDQEGYDWRGYDAQLFNRTGYDRFGIPRSWYPLHDRNEIPSFNIFGYDGEGYNREGRDVHGLDRDGRDAEGYDSYDFNRWGIDRNGLLWSGYSKHHRDMNGEIEPGFRLAPDGNIERDHFCCLQGCSCLDDMPPWVVDVCSGCGMLLEDDDWEPDWYPKTLCQVCHEYVAADSAGFVSMPVWKRSGYLGLAEMIARIEEGEDS